MKILTKFYENDDSVTTGLIVDAYSAFGEATMEAKDKAWKALVREVLLAKE